MKKDQSHAAKTREKIQTSMLINRLSDHALGKVDLSPTQVRAIEVLLKKSLPDLQAVTVDGGLDINATVQRIERSIVRPTDSNG